MESLSFSLDAPLAGALTTARAALWLLLPVVLVVLTASARRLRRRRLADQPRRPTPTVLRVGRRPA